MNGYESHSSQFMEAFVRRDNRCTQKGGWRSVPPRVTLPAGVGSDGFGPSSPTEAKPATPKGRKRDSRS